MSNVRGRKKDRARKIEFMFIKKGCTIENLAKVLGINVVTCRNKVRGDTYFTTEQLIEIQKILELSDDELFKIFIDDSSEFTNYYPRRKSDNTPPEGESSEK